MWEHELNDWRWALGVNVWGVIHGIKAFVPAMLAQRRRGPRRQHVVGQRRHLAAAGHADLRADQVGGRHAHRVALRAAAAGRRADRRLGAVPGPERAAHRPVRVVAQPARRARQPDAAPARHPTTIEAFEKAHGRRRRRRSTTRRSRRSPAGWSTPSAPATFWILPPSERSRRADHARGPSRCSPATNPTYIRDLGG